MLDYYCYLPSPPSRAALMLAEALNIPLNLKEVNTFIGEQMNPEFIKINPQHQIPTLVDGDFTLWESRAILTYLANKYGKGSTLYPEDPQARAVVDQRLYFDMGSLFQRLADVLGDRILHNVPIAEHKIKRMHESLEYLNRFLQGQEWVAGPNLTIADLSILATVTSFQVLDIDIFQYPNIKAWYARMEQSAPGFHLNAKGTKTYVEEIKKFLKKKDEETT